MSLSVDTPYLRYWIYRHGGHDWRVLSQTNDLTTAHWLYANARDQLWPIAVRLVDVETTTVLEEAASHEPVTLGARPALRW